MAERLPPCGCFTRFVDRALPNGAGREVARQARACDGFVCVDASVVSACTDASFVRKPVRLVLGFFGAAANRRILSHESLSRAGFLPYLSATSHY